MTHNLGTVTEIWLQSRVYTSLQRKVPSLTPSFRNWLFAYHLVTENSLTNMILLSFVILKVLKSTAKF